MVQRAFINGWNKKASTRSIWPCGGRGVGVINPVLALVWKQEVSGLTWLRCAVPQVWSINPYPSALYISGCWIKTNNSEHIGCGFSTMTHHFYSFFKATHEENHRWNHPPGMIPARANLKTWQLWRPYSWDKPRLYWLNWPKSPDAQISFLWGFNSSVSWIYFKSPFLMVNSPAESAHLPTTNASAASSIAWPASHSHWLCPTIGIQPSEKNTNHQHIERFTVWCETHNWDFTDCWIIKIIVCSHQPIVWVH